MGSFSRGGPHGGAVTAKVKGTLVVTLMKYLRSRGVDPADVLHRLPPSDRTRLQDILLPSAWYPADTVARFVELAVAAVATGSKAQCLFDMGRYSAQLNLGPSGLRRAYIREGNPHHVLAAISRIYQTVYSVGRRSYERVGERSAVVRGHGTRAANDSCDWVRGWLVGVVELSGGKDVRVAETQCEGFSAPHCEYVIEWT